MKPLPFTQARFLASAFTVEAFPTLRSLHGSLLDEIALVGRSNVGKSSLINHLLQKKGLAKTSSTPGKTQSINFFEVDQQLVLVDLPGYGYARLSKEVRSTWATLIDTYLHKRSQLKLILLLIDVRRSLTEDDLALIAWAQAHSKPLVLVFTKTDKLTRAEKQRHPGAPQGVTHLYYSVKDALSRPLLIKTINAQLDYHGTH